MTHVVTKILMLLSLFHVQNVTTNALTITYKNTLHGHTKASTKIIRLHDGRIASASWDGSVKIWDQNKNDCITPKKFIKPIFSLLEIAPDVLISAGQDKKIRVWNVKNKKCTSYPWKVDGTVLLLAKTNDGKVLSASTDGWVATWDYKDGTLSLYSNAWIPSISFDTVSKNFLLRVEDKNMVIVDPLSFKKYVLAKDMVDDPISCVSSVILLEQGIVAAGFIYYDDPRLVNTNRTSLYLWRPGEEKSPTCLYEKNNYDVDNEMYVRCFAELPNNILAAGLTNGDVLFFDLSAWTQSQKTIPCLKTISCVLGVNTMTFVPHKNELSGNLFIGLEGGDIEVYSVDYENKPPIQKENNNKECIIKKLENLGI